MSRVVVHRRVAKYLRRLPGPRKDQVKVLLRQLEREPLSVSGVKPMAGEWLGYRRVKLGDLRVIFWFDIESDTVYVDHVGPRGDVYKK